MDSLVSFAGIWVRGKPLRAASERRRLTAVRCVRAERRNAFQASELILIGDGAPWIWELARIHFPTAVRILDFSHASEHLTPLAEALHPDDEPNAQSTLRRWQGCKTQIAQRRKQSGMLWSLEGAQNILTFRWASSSRRFDQAWDRLRSQLALPA